MYTEDQYRFLTNLYSMYYASMLTKARKYTQNHWDAEDVVSECWVDLLRHAERIHALPISEQRAYVMRSVSNRAIDYVRHKRRNREFPCEEVGCFVNPAELIDNINDEEEKQQRSTLNGLLFHLTPRERAVVNLRLSNLSTEEIARMLNITPSSVRVYLARATIRLKDYIQSMDVTD